MDSQAPASDPRKTAVSPATAPRVSDRGDGGAGGRGGAAGRGRFRELVRTLGEVAELFAASTPGLTIVAVLGLKALIALFGGAASGWLRVLDAAGTLALVVALGYLLVRMLNLLQQRFLWRVRRKLVLSYVLIGFVPILLFGAFFLLSGWMLLSTVSSSLVQLSFADVVDDSNGLAAMTSIELRGRVDPAEVRAVLANRVGAIQERYPDASIVVVAGKPTSRGRVAAAGPWRHASRDFGFPDWLGDEADAGGGLVLTRGSRGMAVFAPGRPTVHIPVFGTDEVADVTGAGDTVIATVTLALAAGAALDEAARLANYAGGIVVMKRGTATVSAAELRRAVRADAARQGS